MKKIFFLFIIFRSLIAQDSLYWFDMSTVRDKMPDAPKVLDQIFRTSQLNIVDSLKTLRISTRDGFRLQIYEASSVDEANQEFRKLRRILPDSLYMVFDAPLYKIRYGNYVTKNDAEISKQFLDKKGYRKVWIVKSRIEQEVENNNDN
tara:strand:+ start:348 stop:791 length:444 start_codon:yes stop_codon:yes gene_type:complete